MPSSQQQSDICVASIPGQTGSVSC